MPVTHRSPYVPRPATEVRTIDDPIRVIGQAQADSAGIPYDREAALERFLALAGALKVEMVAAHAYPLDSASSKEWRRQGRSYNGGLDLEDEIALVSELIEQLQMGIKIERQGERS